MVKLFRKITMFVFILQNLTEKKCYLGRKRQVSRALKNDNAIWYSFFFSRR